MDQESPAAGHMLSQSKRLRNTTGLPSSSTADGQTINDEINCISPRIVARRRKTRSVNVSTLPDHVRQRLLEAFSKVDVEGCGSVKAAELVELVKQGYEPTDEEVSNVRRYFNLATGERLEFEALLCAFARASAVVLGDSWRAPGADPVDFLLLRETFHFEVMQVARTNQIEPAGVDGGDTISAAKAVLGEQHIVELQAYFDLLSMAAEDDDNMLREFVRGAFVLPQKKANQLMVFFDSNKDGMVTVDEFMHGMTLLYGELNHLYQQLRTNSPGTPIVSPMSGPQPSPLMSPRLAFDGPAPLMSDITL